MQKKDTISAEVCLNLSYEKSFWITQTKGNILQSTSSHIRMVKHIILWAPILFNLFNI